MGGEILFGFDVEGTKFSKEYVEEKFEILQGKVKLLEIPVYRFFSSPLEINRELLQWFLDLSQSYSFEFTAHAEDRLSFILPYPPDEREKKRAELEMGLAEKIGAKKIVFHQLVEKGIPLLESHENFNVRLTLENTSNVNPFVVQQTARKLGLGFTLDVSHTFLYAAEHEMEDEVYDWFKRFDPEHLHISNTYYEAPSLIESVLFLLKGDPASAFTKLRGDFHLPLNYGHIDFKLVFKDLKIPRTIIMEINTTNYEMLMRSAGKKHSIERGYEEDVKFLRSILKNKRGSQLSAIPLVGRKKLKKVLLSRIQRNNLQKAHTD